jgi:hypothetical protein
MNDSGNGWVRTILDEQCLLLPCFLSTDYF